MPKPTSIPFKEFVTLMALLMSLTPLAIDAVLPALPIMGDDLNVAVANHMRYVISFLFVGFSLGQIIFGPLSDSFGRKKTIYIGVLFFIIGSLLSFFAQSFTMMLIGRFFQGFGAASSRIVTVAITRDQFKGAEMARVMSFIITIFIFVPAIAPTLGQFILFLSHWRSIFLLYILSAVIGIIWMTWRLPETLAPENKRPFRLKSMKTALWVVITNKVTFWYTVCAGLVFGSVIGYVMSAQQIFVGYFDVGPYFPLYFAFSALSIGLASIINSSIVRKYGMIKICHYAFVGIVITSLSFLVVLFTHDQQAPLWGFMIYAVLTFFCLGLIFGNINAIAMEPMGQHAGMASAFVGALSSFISVIAATLIGQAYNHSLMPLIIGFTGLTSGAFIIHLLCQRAVIKMRQ